VSWNFKFKIVTPDGSCAVRATYHAYSSQLCYAELFPAPWPRINHPRRRLKRYSGKAEQEASILQVRIRSSLLQGVGSHLTNIRTGQQIVYAKAGTEKKSFGVHQELICFHSPYFRAAFKGNFQEATTGEVLLDDVDSEVFGLFVQWLYAQDIVESICSDESSTNQGKAGTELPLTRYLIELWLLAEYPQVPMLQNYVLGVIVERTSRRNLCHINSFDVTYERTTRGSILPRFFVDLVCWSTASG
jgi:hypothetical protein